MTSLRRGRVGGARRVIAAAAVLGVAALASSRADAYCRTTTAPVPANYDARTRGCITSGLVLFWKSKCVTYDLNRSAATGIALEDATRILDEAFATWVSATCPSTGARVGISTTDLGPVDCSEVRYNPDGPNQNLIVFREDAWPYNDSANTLGLTTVTFNADTGEIYDADMEINATGHNLSISDPVPANGFDLLSVVTHEAGHFLGLAHATNPASTMYASYKPGTINLRTLTSDDVAGLCAAYPDDTKRIVDTKVAASGFVTADACTEEPRHGFTTKCEEPQEKKGCAMAPSTSPAPAPPVALVVGGVVAVAARRSRKRAAAR